MTISSKVVKKKKLQKLGGTNFCALIPKAWITEMDWNQETNLILEFLPNRKTIIISEENGVNMAKVDAVVQDGKEDGDIVPIDD